MVSRREAIARTAMMGVSALAGRTIPVLADSTQSAVGFAVPAGACDCHAHVFDPAPFPYAPTRLYTPDPAPVEEMRVLHRALGIARVVIVQPSVYGTDNACTLEAIRQLAPAARGVAVIDDAASDAALGEMEKGGIRGARINLETAGQTDPAEGRRRFERMVGRLTKRKWHVQIYTRPTVIQGIADLVRSSPIPVVFDHFGGAQAVAGLKQPGFDTLVELVRKGHAYVKISAPYRSSTQAPYSDMAPFAQALIGANPQRILWGSDWPHPDSTARPGRQATDIAPRFPIDDGVVLNQLAVWAPAADLRKQILVDNPARLYGFD